MSNITQLNIKELDLEMINPSTTSFDTPGNKGGSKTVIIGKPG